VRRDLVVPIDSTGVRERAGQRRETGPRLLLISMYPLDRGLWGPTVRITHLRDELARMVRLDVIDGYRGARRLALARYAFSGKMRGLDGIYVESSSALPSEVDIAFLGLARALRIPVLTYFRDAYQLFPEYYTADTPRRWLGAKAFLPAERALAAVSTAVAAPSVGLARAVLAERPVVLLPPGSREPVDVPLDSDASDLLFVGNARDDVQGAPRLIEAVTRARTRHEFVTLTIVCRPGEEPTKVPQDGVRVINAEGGEIDQLLPKTIATVIARPRNAYNDLALPVKLFDYLAMGRPLLVTNCTETARVVLEAGCGLVVKDSAAAIAEGIVEVASMAPEARMRMGDAAHRAAIANSWTRRAETILATLDFPAGGFDAEKSGGSTQPLGEALEPSDRPGKVGAGQNPTHHQGNRKGHEAGQSPDEQVGSEQAGGGQPERET